MTELANRLRRGDYCIVESSHSYTSLKDGTHRYVRFAVAKVVGVTREGRATTFILAGTTYRSRVDRTRRIWTLSSEYIKGAKALFESAKEPAEYLDKAALGIALRLAADTA